MSATGAEDSKNPNTTLTTIKDAYVSAAAWHPNTIPQKNNRADRIFDKGKRCNRYPQTNSPIIYVALKTVPKFAKSLPFKLFFIPITPA
ncbi:hypothetical protein WICMUC_002465 [Wickerhamomyces mucosus]|uniref:Uncharacterized protein n=1 Tax=Wickerhamomyces mucosus TaxID=1378264 RepID=A0A9P8PQM2_9ASCO|nr:hypothetical protein WICMUC_002465 [Wickerhamomyces mucosus]